MTIKEMQEKKREFGYTNELIARLSGVPLGTVQKLFAGLTKAPRRKTVEAIEKVLQPDFQEPGLEKPAYIREGAPAYKVWPKQGQYTLEDYYALPDDRRVELIDGVFYDMAAPSQKHQLILGEMFLQMAPCVENHPGCRIYFAPLDVRLDNDNKTMVQPDLVILCKEYDGDWRRVNGAPDFAAEIISPTSRYHDTFRKFNKYLQAGVREYWIIDPRDKKVTVYDFEHECLPDTYTFDDTVEVRISGGKCRVNFKKIEEKIKVFERE